MLRFQVSSLLILLVIGGLGIGGQRFSLAAPARPGGAAAPQVTLERVPDRGIQPQVAVDKQGVVHLIYFKGDPAKGDVYYVRSTDAGQTFSQSIRVNSQAGSAIAIGNIRGPQIAAGKSGRVHVAWNGSSAAEPRLGTSSPMLYSRLDDAGSAFEPQRNIIQNHPGLDGGGSVAADGEGNVYVTWHAPETGKRGEENRRVWVARSSDEGRTFAEERPAIAESTGACGCCGMSTFADSQGRVFVMYRSASQTVNRDMYLLTSLDEGNKFTGKLVSPWKVDRCVMSSTSFYESPSGVVTAWEAEGQVYFGQVAGSGSTISKSVRPVPAPGGDGKRKYPVVAVNASGQTILVWTEGMGWQRGGAVAWQVYDRTGKPLAGQQGRNDGVPVWSLVAVFSRPDGGFTILY